ncbi:MAG TPA: DUF3472 domain-containing protein [Balneolaceae bacterium]|nr:DUF3472 domain-containing protein [Balneolaceae bacterium]
MGGNAYITKGPQTEDVTDKGIIKWKTLSNIYSTFVKLNKSINAKLAIRARILSGKSTIRFKVGNLDRKITLRDTTFKQISLGRAHLKKGYNQFEITGLSKSGANVAQISDLILQVPRNDSLTYVKDNEKNHYYWGRRGPSVHLDYKLPAHKDIEWFYSEITVPKGEDPVGSYFMADGFGQGYFGMQVNSPAKRHILFSVWSPDKTNNPDNIPDSLQVKLLQKGQGVHVGKFGNEGSGGQSYWNYDWKPGATYRFLVKVKPHNDNTTNYTAYFYAPAVGQWKLIAKFQRPQTHTWLTGAYSFLENFDAHNGYKNRKAFYSNQWARDQSGKWHEITNATFTGDNIANIGYRTDYKGAVEDGKFYLMNGGFFDDKSKLNRKLIRQSAGQAPKVKFSSLPGN